VLLDGEKHPGSGYSLNPSAHPRGHGVPEGGAVPAFGVENVAFGLRHHIKLSRGQMEDRVEKALREAALWTRSRTSCNPAPWVCRWAATAPVHRPRGRVAPAGAAADEPTSALDPIATGRIEQLLSDLQNDYTIVIVTHNMQAGRARVDLPAYMYLGEMVEFGATAELFTRPQRRQTEDYITGRFG